jgi:hypothetical protein
MFEPFANHYLQTALSRAAAREGFSKRIAWWLTSPHGAERWLQFELAFELQQLYQNRFAVLCEHRVPGAGTASDIVLIQNEQIAYPVWESQPAGVFELKLSGNWYFNGRNIPVLQSDVAKVNELPVPAVAAVCCVVVEPTQCLSRETTSPYRWIVESLESGIGAPSFEKQMEGLCSADFQYELTGEPIKLSVEGCDSVQLALLVHRNPAAKETLPAMFQAKTK